MPIYDDASDVSEMELQVARRWAKVFRALLDEGNPDAQAIVNEMNRWAGGVERIREVDAGLRRAWGV